MNPEAYTHILLASLAGGLAGVLVMWNRKRSWSSGQSNLRGFTVLSIGTASFGFAWMEFSKTLPAHSGINAAVAMMVLTGWAAVLNSVVSLPVPYILQTVRVREFAILRSPWSGVRLFGAILRGTPLRRLGGRVFLSEAGRDVPTVLAGIRAAQAVHVWAIVFCVPLLIFWAARARWQWIFWALAVQVMLNLYPILHLRFVSFRLAEYVKRKGKGRKLQGKLPESAGTAG